jgi:hypothetical protein
MKRTIWAVILAWSLALAPCEQAPDNRHDQMVAQSKESVILNLDSVASLLYHASVILDETISEPKAIIVFSGGDKMFYEKSFGKTVLSFEGYTAIITPDSITCACGNSLELQKLNESIPEYKPAIIENSSAIYPWTQDRYKAKLHSFIWHILHNEFSVQMCWE